MMLATTQLPPSTAPAGAVPAAALPVRAVALGKTIESRNILRNINLDITPGTFVALLGANGAGKSTLLKILATLNAPSSGMLELFGISSTAHAAKVRRHIGLIGHQTMLYHDLSALENLTFFAKLYGIAHPQRRALDLLGQLGLASRAGDPVKAFSRGMSQRVAIARALLHEPQLLLADEPFAGLDAPSTALLERLLSQLHAQGKTIILANHDISQSLRLAQRAVVLAGGQKVIDAPARALDAATVLARMESRGAA
jgi:ABC-type multidrug transport system ATPase subunit